MYKNLVFKGGGVKSFSSVGAIHALESSGALDGVERVAGSSAGALMALMVSIKVPYNEIEDFMINLDLRQEESIADTQEKTERFFKDYGLYTGKFTRDKIETLLTDKTGNKNITFQELHDKGFKDLYVTGTNISTSKLEIFSHESTPDIKVVDALQISGSYPMYFAPTKLNGNLYLDGGIIDNYPIKIFDDDKYLPNYCKDSVHNPETLGVFLGSVDESSGLIQGLEDLKNIIIPFNTMDEKIMKEEMTKLDYDKIINGVNDIDSVSDLASVVFNITSTKIIDVNHDFIHEVVIDSQKNISALDFDLSDDTIRELLDNGYNTTVEYIKIHDGDFFHGNNTYTIV